MRRIWISLLAGVILFPFLPPQEAQAQHGTSYSAQVVAHGVGLSLSFARRPYPRDALVRMTVRVRNVSRHVVMISRTGGTICDQWGPGVRVTDAKQQVVYPPAADWVLSSCGPPILPRPVRPGHSVTRTLLAILRGARVQAVVTLGQQSIEVLTPPVKLRLSVETPPHLSITTTGAAEIDVAPTSPEQRGRFYLTYSIICFTSGSVGSGTGDPEFSRGSVRSDGVFRISAGCTQPTRWSFAGGWLNHPAVSVNYVAPGGYSR